MSESDGSLTQTYWVFVGNMCSIYDIYIYIERERERDYIPLFPTKHQTAQGARTHIVGFLMAKYLSSQWYLRPKGLMFGPLDPSTGLHGTAQPLIWLSC